jgi:hypothetical protein
MKNPLSWQDASKAEWKEACRRETVIRPLVEEGHVSNARADQAAEELGISRSLGVPLGGALPAASSDIVLVAGAARPTQTQSVTGRAG